MVGTAAAGLAAPSILSLPRARAEGPITLGVVTPLSGAQQIIGAPIRMGAEIAVKMLNTKGGIMGREVRLEFRDEKASPNEALVGSRELLGMGANMQLGTVSSSVALAQGPLMTSDGGALIVAGVGTLRLNHDGYNPNVFRIGSTQVVWHRALVRAALEKNPGVDTWGALIPDHEFGRTTWALFVESMKAVYPEVNGGKQPTILDAIYVPFGQGDYKSYIAQAARLDAKGIYTSVYGGDAVTLYQQAKPYRLFDKFQVLLDGANDLLVAKAMGKEVPAFWCGTHWYSQANITAGKPLASELYNAYVERTKDKYSLGWLAEGHGNVLAYAAAIEKAGSTETADVVAALKGLTFETANGPRTIRAEDNQATKGIDVFNCLPDEAADVGFKIGEFLSVDGAQYLEPATPGQAYVAKI